jgi:hypothetical protein
MKIQIIATAILFILLPQWVKASTNRSLILEVAKNHPDCRRIAPFYLEIANKDKIIVSEEIGGNQFKRETIVPIASSSKWIFAGYVAQKLDGQIDAKAQSALTMRSGYTQFNVSTCIENNFETVEECGMYASNTDYTIEHQNRFYYNNGHHQKWAMDNGLGSMNKTELSGEINHYLGLGPDLDFYSMQLGGGMSLSARGYATFLQALLNNELELAENLGSFSTCTWGQYCPQAVYSPVELPDLYSLGHWVESLDGAYSSAGLFGFYPWIDRDKKTYGIISRFSVDFTDGLGYGPGYTSMLCGQALRQAVQTKFY